MAQGIRDSHIARGSQPLYLIDLSIKNEQSSKKVKTKKT